MRRKQQQRKKKTPNVSEKRDNQHQLITFCERSKVFSLRCLLFYLVTYIHERKIDETRDFFHLDVVLRIVDEQMDA